MKSFNKAFLILILLSSCKKNNDYILNSFTVAKDTLIIRTEKQKGENLFPLGAVPIEFKKQSDTFPYPIKYPNQIQNAQRFLLETDFQEKEHFYVDIIKGIKNRQEVFSVDENNNKDLSDDKIRPIEIMKWDSTEPLIKCRYLISNGNEIVTDSSWIKIGLVNKRLFVGRSEHLLAKFNIDNNNYEIGIIEYRNARSFTYGLDSEISLISQNGKRIDSINKRDLRKLGEFINLNGASYKFDSISNNGEYISLVKEKHTESKIGTQVGMIAPAFKIVTTKGDTINSSNLFNKTTIIANSCGCGGDVESTNAFYEIQNNYKDINVLHIDSNIKTNLDGLHIDMQNTFNQDFYKKYRMQYCSRMCYVIGDDKRILDKFLITDWKNNLPELIKE
ncbi:hypothetical protein [Winogradskyella thalassocola]|uniref:Uncharacterized protein n=1 Tax=Winogradskyella thalassocola TaxID=262004 RepID=A0A1G8HE34_9FLAO|nr:hypothetical protein [Winogradskyella thalassocola]SDI04740.1 hypothetical protein SAMN04489796_106199 [Winogradskyella thalassocola]